MENRIKVVLADANENFRTMLQQTIENTGEFDVVGSAGDGAEAWKMIERERPQLVITDVILPELDGFALLDGWQSCRHGRRRSWFPPSTASRW